MLGNPHARRSGTFAFRRHPSGVRQLHNGCCPKGSAADPVLTVALALQAEPPRC
ncbi:MAG: hypothetical protein LBK25_03940 [Treponema sp.]|nr:hypothetical protein [Treponema sp.]